MHGNSHVYNPPAESIYNRMREGMYFVFGEAEGELWNKFPEEGLKEKSTEEKRRIRFEEAVFKHIEEEMKLFPDVNEWDVANEVASHQLMGNLLYREYDEVGSRLAVRIANRGTNDRYLQFVASCYDKAREVNPNAKLVFNDAFTAGNKTSIYTNCMIDILKKLNAKTNNIDVFGIQYHVGNKYHNSPQCYYNEINYILSETGTKEAIVTEYDNFVSGATYSEAEKTLRADYFRDTLISAYSNPNISEFASWAYTSFQNAEKEVYKDFINGEYFLDKMKLINYEEDGKTENGCYSTRLYEGNYTVTTTIDGEEYNVDFDVTSDFESSIPTIEIKEKDKDLKIYFLSEVTKGYGQADCILLEKNGHFGLIDSGRIETNSENYRGLLVNQFLKDHGVEKLDFFLITHIHTDHIGGAEAVLNEFPVDTLYIQQFDTSLNTSQKLYKNVIRAALVKSGEGNFNKPIKIVGTNLDNLMKMDGWSKLNWKTWFNANEDSTIEAFNENNTIFDFAGEEMHILNWSLYDENGNFIDYTYDGEADENARSLCLYFQHGNKKLLFTGDLDNYFGGEDKIAEIVGDIDFLKVGHHGYTGSNTLDYLNTIKPEYAVITNDVGMAENDTINWLDENNVEYYYTTEDEKSMIVTVSNDNIEVNYQTLGKFVIKQGQRYFLRDLDENEEINNWKDLAVEVKTISEEVSVSNWEDLKTIITTQPKFIVWYKEENAVEIESLKITLNQSENWLATSTIDIKPYQDIILIPEENKDVSITRDEKFKDSLFLNEGNLTLGQEDMSGKLSFVGNKELVNADSSIIEVSYGILNMYNNIYIKDNKHFNDSNILTDTADVLKFSTHGAGVSLSDMAIFNMYGGTIQNNEAYNGFVISSEQMTSKVNRVDSNGAGVYMNGGSVFNMSGGAIIDNVALNESKVEMANNSETNITVRCNGAGIYSGKGTVNINGGEITGNSVINNSNILVPETGSKGNNEVSSYGGGVFTNNTNVSINNCKIDGNRTINNTITTVNLTDSTTDTGSLTQNINNISRGGNIYCSVSKVHIDNCEIMNGTVSRKAITEFKTSSGTTKAQNTFSSGGGIQLVKTISFDMKNSKLHDNEAYDGGGIYALNASIEMEDSKVYDNVATRRGGGIYSSGDGSDLKLNNMIIMNNEAMNATAGRGGAIYVQGKSEFSGKNNNIYSNSAKQNGGGIYVENKEATVNLEDLFMRNNQTASGESGEIFSNENSKISGYMIYEKGTIVEQVLKDIQLNTENLVVTDDNQKIDNTEEVKKDQKIKLDNDENNINLLIAVKGENDSETTWENFNNSTLNAKYDSNTKKLLISR